MNLQKTKRIATALVALSLTAAPAAVMASEYATVKGGGLNLRQTPSLDAKVLGQYWTGTWVEILDKGDTWCKVSVGGKSGYMMTKFLNMGSTGNTLYVRTNTGIGLNMRKGPGTTYPIITSFPIGTAVELLQKGNEWNKVKVGKSIGYMSAKYLSAEKNPEYTKPVKPFQAVLRNINGGSIVNFRLYPGMNTKILKTLPVGTVVTVTETGENWSKVTLKDGSIGYVSTYFLVKK